MDKLYVIAKGNIEMLILYSLLKSDKYSSEIADDIQEQSMKKYEIKTPTLYAYLKRLENKKQIDAYWGEESKGGRRRYYTLASIGEKEVVDFLKANSIEIPTKVQRDLASKSTSFSSESKPIMISSKRSILSDDISQDIEELLKQAEEKKNQSVSNKTHSPTEVKFELLKKKSNPLEQISIFEQQNAQKSHLTDEELRRLEYQYDIKNPQPDTQELDDNYMDSKYVFTGKSSESANISHPYLDYALVSTKSVKQDSLTREQAVSELFNQKGTQVKLENTSLDPELIFGKSLKKPVNDLKFDNQQTYSEIENIDELIPIDNNDNQVNKDFFDDTTLISDIVLPVENKDVFKEEQTIAEKRAKLTDNNYQEDIFSPRFMKMKIKEIQKEFLAKKIKLKIFQQVEQPPKKEITYRKHNLVVSLITTLFLLFELGILVVLDSIFQWGGSTATALYLLLGYLLVPLTFLVLTAIAPNKRTVCDGRLYIIGITCIIITVVGLFLMFFVNLVFVKPDLTQVHNLYNYILLPVAVILTTPAWFLTSKLTINRYKV